MISGIGVDIVEVSRFIEWRTRPLKKLQRIFSKQEIAYCLQSPINSAQRFAVRFAAKEALVKALTTTGVRFPFLYICRHATISTSGDCKKPHFIMTDTLREAIPLGTVIHVSLSHTKEYAVAFVTAENTVTY